MSRRKRISPWGINNMRLLTVKQLSGRINFKAKTIYDWVHRKRIPYLKIEGSLRFDYDEVLRWLKNKRHKPKKILDIL